ncbi:MAG: response regulator [Deltaproteobacteria bacterium]|nr:response regulator [Deltaproteobacteria bacterium]
MNKMLVKEILTLNGYSVSEAKSGLEAIKLLSAGSSDERPDIILMDLHLPVMDGYTATRIIKADERNKGIPILALTASAMKGDEEKILGMGFDGYIAKPIDVKKLADIVADFLKGSGCRKSSGCKPGATSHR